MFAEGLGVIHKAKTMADLPKNRLQPSPQFTYVAMDFFGPFYIKEGCKELKRYGVLFTCMVSPAIHLETANSLDANSFGWRRPVSQLRSDQGANFDGANNELSNCLKEMNQ